MEKNYSILVLIFAFFITFGLLESANTQTVINFDGLGNHTPIPQDRNEAVNIDLTYNTVAGIGSTIETYNYLSAWTTGYGDLSSAAFATYSNKTGQIIFTPDPGHGVTINSLDAAIYEQSSINPQRIVIYDFNQLTMPLWDSGWMNFPLYTHTTLYPNLTHHGAIRLQFGTNWNFGINNISYAVSPEPSTVLLLGSSLVGLGLISYFRRKRA